MSAAPEYNLGDLDSDIRHLSDVIEVLAYVTYQLDAKEWADSLLWLIRDEAKRMVKNVDGMFPVGERRAEV